MKYYGVPVFYSNLIGSVCLATSVIAGPIETMDIGDHTVEFVQEGSGRPVIFVHGSLSDLSVWDQFPALFSDEFNVIAYNQRYFGAKEWPDDGSGFSITTLFDDLIAFAEGLDQGPVDLVTWSMGGEIGINVTMMRPDLFRSAVHYEPVSMLDMSGVEGYEAASEELDNKFGPVFDALEAGNENEGAFRFIEAVFDLPEGGAQTYSSASIDMWKRNARTIIPNFSTDDPPEISCDQLQEVKTPTLILIGNQTYDDFSMQGSEHAKCLGNATLQVLENVNHNGPIKDPETFSTSVMNFLRAN